MPTATFRFYAELNDFLPEERRFRALPFAFDVSPSVKDAIESFGVPHTEVDLIIANGESVGFDYRVRPGDFISVYPVFESIDISPIVKVRPEPLREPRFVLDAHLGRLARYLRALGFDTLYQPDSEDDALAHISRAEGRILLTRDRGLLKRGMVTHGYWVRATQPREQVVEVVRRFDLAARTRPFTRCVHCNGELRPATREEVRGRVPPGVLEDYDEFRVCQACGHVYWPGSHYRRMCSFIREVMEDASRNASW